MQTFKASDSDNPKKPEYKPFLPEDVDNFQDDSLQSTLPRENATSFDSGFVPQMTPEQNQAFSSPLGMSAPVSQSSLPYNNGLLPSQDGVSETFFYQPEHVYYPPTPAAFQAGHAGLDRRQFRSLIIGFLLLGLAAFILIIIIFGKRGSQDYFSQQRNIADVVVSQPVYEQVVAPPFQIIGKARGYWYGDDGAFPIQVFDAKDNPVAFGTALAQTPVENENDFVPFQAIVYDYQFWPAKKDGYITLQRPDVSPDMATIYTIPIEFKKQRGSYVVGEPLTTSTSDTTTNTNTTNTSSSSSSNSTTGVNNRSCANGLDDDNDGLYDVQDPECHFDFNAFNFSSYNPGGKELDSANVPPTTVQVEETVDTDDDTTSGSTGTGVWEEIDWVPAFSN